MTPCINTIYPTHPRELMKYGPIAVFYRPPLSPTAMHAENMSRRQKKYVQVAIGSHM